jgi:nicotinic acid mononucleotide adenylyltransferase
MLNRALKPHRRLSLLEAVETKFTVRYSLPRLQRVLPNTQLVLLVGSDVAMQLAQWPDAARLLKSTELVVGLREGVNENTLRHEVASWPVQPQALTVFTSYAPVVSSGKIRKALQQGKKTAGLLASVRRYSRKHWLYITLQRYSK